MLIAAFYSCRYAECRYADCRGAFLPILFAVMAHSSLMEEDQL
jgi:hypothetical protein